MDGYDLYLDASNLCQQWLNALSMRRRNHQHKNGLIGHQAFSFFPGASGSIAVAVFFRSEKLHHIDEITCVPLRIDVLHMLEKNIVHGEDKRVHIGKASFSTVFCGYHTSATKGADRVKGTRIIGEYRAGADIGNQRFLGRVTAARTDVSHAIDRHPGREPAGSRFPGDGFQIFFFTDLFQMGEDPVALKGGHGDIGCAAVGTKFFTSQIERSDESIVYVHHLLKDSQFFVYVHN